jgi:hypothetical protein
MNSSIDHNLNRIFINLKIISNIKEYDKLLTLQENDIIEIDNAGLIQPLRRWWNGRNRNETIDFLNTFISETFIIIDDTLNNEISGTSNTNFFKESNHNILQRFLLELTNSMKGLHNLKITYGYDIKFKSQLDTIIEGIEFRVEKIKESLRINVA